MKLSKAAKIWIDYHETHSKKNTARSNRTIIEQYIKEFGDGPIDQVTPEHILTFLKRLNKGDKPIIIDPVASFEFLLIEFLQRFRHRYQFLTDTKIR